jgi:hypothetical protein
MPEIKDSSDFKITRTSQGRAEHKTQGLLQKGIGGMADQGDDEQWIEERPLRDCSLC